MMERFRAVLSLITFAAFLINASGKNFLGFQDKQWNDEILKKLLEYKVAAYKETDNLLE